MTTPFWQAGTLYPPGSLVQPVTAPPIVATPIVNPGFESGSANWTLGGGWTVGAFGAGTAFTGSQSAQFNLTGTGNIDSTTTGVVTPGQSITASCMVQQGASSAGQAGARVVIVWTTAANVYISQTDGNLVDNASGGAWLQSTATGIAPAGAGKAYVRAAAFRLSGSSPLWVDTFTWNHTGSAAPAGLVYKAIQALTASSAASEPVWPLTPLATVVDGGVTWQATVATRVVWEAEPILKSGSPEPTWPLSAGASVSDGTISWKAISRQVVDLNCPNSTVVAIMASKVFAVDEDIVRFSATVNPLDWTSEKDAGFLATGLQQANSNNMAVLAPYRGNMAAFNASSFQNWQVDPDPTAMAILDQMDGIGSTYHKAAVAVGDELLFLSALGVRSVGMSGANESLSNGDVGMPIDPLVQEAIELANTSGLEPIATYYPALGQYWLAFRQPGPTISGDAPDSAASTLYNYAYSVGGFFPPFTVTLLSGTLPPGLSISPAGVLSGTTGPTPQTYSYVLRNTDALGQTADIGDSITVSAACAWVPLHLSGLAYVDSLTGGFTLTDSTVSNSAGVITPSLYLGVTPNQNFHWSIIIVGVAAVGVRITTTAWPKPAGTPVGRIWYEGINTPVDSMAVVIPNTNALATTFLPSPATFNLYENGGTGRFGVWNGNAGAAAAAAGSWTIEVYMCGGSPGLPP